MKKLAIIIVFLISGIFGFGQGLPLNGLDINNLKVKDARYDSVRSITNSLQLVPQWYVDQAVVGYTAKPEAEAATTENITLSGNQTIDGYSAVTNDTILVKDQTNPAENGIYFVGVPWVRADYANTWEEIYKSSVFVTGGTVNSNSTFSSYMDATGTLETDSIYWNLSNRIIIPTLTGYVLDSLRFKNGRVYAYFVVKTDSTVVLFTEGNLTENITGMAITGTGEVINGSLNIELESGYQIPSVSQLNDAQTAYQDKINSIDVTGTGTKTITLTQQDATTLSDSFSDLDSQIVTYNQNTRDVSITKGTGFNLPLATASIAGLMSPAKFNKLDSLPYNGGNWTGLFDGQEGSYYLSYNNLTGKPTIPIISNAAYGTSWNGNLDGASKDAIYDKIQTLAAGTHALSTGHTDVSMSGIVANNVIQYNGKEWTNKTLFQAGIQALGRYMTSMQYYRGTYPYIRYQVSGTDSLNLFEGTLQLDTVTSSYSGMMTPSKLAKLNGIATGAEVNVNADWSALSGDAQILNKPDLLLRTDTLRNAAEPIVTKHWADSLISNAIAATPDNTWTLDVDTVKAVVGHVRHDTVIMGTANIYLPVYATYTQTTKYLEVDTVITIYQTKRYIFNETGLIRYKIATSDNVTYYLQRQINGGSWVNLRTITCPEAYISTVVPLKCSNYGDVVAYIDFLNPTYKLYVSRDYGVTWSESVIGNTSTVIECAALDVSDDGTLVACATYKDAVSNAPIYIYRNSLSQRVLAQETRRVENIKVLSDSTIYYSVLKTGSSQDRCLYKILPAGTQSSKNSSLYGMLQFDVENDNIYVCDSSKILKSTNGGTSFTTLYDFTTALKTYQVNVSADESYIYVTVDDDRLYQSSNSGGAFDVYYASSTPARYAYLEINEGIFSDYVRYNYENGRMRFLNGAISMYPGYVPKNLTDVATYGDIVNRMGVGSTGDISGVYTPTNSGLSGGASNGDVYLRLSIPNISDYKTSTNLANGDRLIIGDGNAAYATKYATLGEIKTFIGLGGGFGVSSITAGPGLTGNFITGDVTLSMGTPATLTKLTTNASTGTTHTHVVNLASFAITDLGGIPTPTTNTILKWNGSAYVWVAESTGATGNVVSAFYALSGAIPTWDAVTYRNARLTMPSSACTLTFSVAPANGDVPATLVVVPYVTTQTLTFPAGYYFTNGHSRNFSIEANTRYRFTFVNTGSEILIDYASYKIAN